MSWFSKGYLRFSLDSYGQLSKWIGSQKDIYGSLWIVTDSYPYELVLKRIFSVLFGYLRTAIHMIWFSKGYLRFSLDNYGRLSTWFGYQKDNYGRLSTWFGSQKDIYGSLWIITDGYPYDLVIKRIFTDSYLHELVLKRIFTVLFG